MTLYLVSRSVRPIHRVNGEIVMAKFILKRASDDPYHQGTPHNQAKYDSANNLYYIELDTIKNLLDFTSHLNGASFKEPNIIIDAHSMGEYDGSITIYDDYIE